MSRMLDRVKKDLPGYEATTDLIIGARYFTHFKFIGNIDPGSVPREYIVMIRDVIPWFDVQKMVGYERDAEGYEQYNIL